MSRFRVLVVDDEPLARETVAALAGRDAEVEVVGEAGDGRRARELMATTAPDIVFLDIEMPELDGLGVADGLAPERRPVFVFVTAYADYAPRAFDVQASDYVLKPFSDDRFAKALGRAKRRVRERRLGELATRVAGLSAELQPGEAAPAGERLRIESGGRTLFVPIGEIVWIESQDYYCRLHTTGGHHLLRASLASFEERLPEGRFIRAHRSALVALAAVRELVPIGRGARALVLSDGRRVRVARSRLRAVERALGSTA